MIISGRSNEFELKQATDPVEVEAAQRLRWQVFYEEMGAAPDHEREVGIDRDEFDDIAEHLLVIDRFKSTPGNPAVVGCYRAVRQDIARHVGGLYTEREFALCGPLKGSHDVMELGRSCVHRDNRGGLVLQLLWRGIAMLIERHDIHYIIGCASFHGTNLGEHAASLAYLHKNHLAQAKLRPRPLGPNTVPMIGGVFDKEALAAGRRALPPLIKGYLRAGALVGDGAVIDQQFNTLDVCMVLPTVDLRDRHRKHFQLAATKTEALSAS